jgi:hypothetical protein
MLILVAGLLCFATDTARSVGPFTDVSRLSAFLRSPHESSLGGSITRADAQETGASLFALAADFPVRSAFLLQLEIPYVTLALDDKVEDGFGDALLRMKARLWTGARRSLAVTSTLRMGSGSVSLFPFASGSTDIEAGLVFIDSIGVGEGEKTLEPLRSISYWVLGGGAYPIRVNEGLEKAGLYGRYVTAGGGVLAALTRRIEIEAGGLGLFFDTGAVREIYFSRLSLALSDVSRLSLSVQGERGDSQDRAADASAGINLTVMY